MNDIPKAKYQMYETVDCECGHTCPTEYAISDQDGEVFICPDCFIQEISDRTVRFKTLVSGFMEGEAEFMHPIAVGNHYEWATGDMPLVLMESTSKEELEKFYEGLDFSKAELREMLITIQ